MSSIKDYRGDKPSASASERWINCSASHLRCLAIPEETSEQAERGTYLHKCCELYFTDFEAFQVMSKDLPRDEFDAVMFAVSQVEQMKNSESETLFEKRLWSKSEMFSGQADVIIIDGESAKIIDYKFGRGQVSHAIGNWQLCTLAVLVDANFPSVKQIDAFIVQPFAEEKRRITSVRYDERNLKYAHEHIERAIDDVLLRPVENVGAWCEHCKARATCTAVRNEIATIGKYEITEANACETFRKIKIAKSVLEQMEKRVHEIATENDIAGLTWKDGARRAKFKNANSVFGFFSQIISADEFIDAVDVNKTKLQNLYVAKMQSVEPSRSKAEIEREFNKTINEVGLVEYVQNKPTLILEQD